ncbi:small integral membrane protein DUF2273 [Tumebacillus sp. BK434]|uniref:DUF2273 domain-containing protein n=1 Tax=Tumebacillus sp. BK434 TaxID=2512169 RepID=UPI001043C4FC|nr:DUF2273 domain-containing protein [Tumebacillus sp. BK434]TCP52848.1 small integral membrane protein DUF2273 [Tumebacillus sp. BK434]
MDKWLKLLETLSGNKRLLGTVIGVLLGLFFLIFGLLKTIIFGFFVIGGFYVGKMIEEREDWRDVIDKIVPDKYRD